VPRDLAAALHRLARERPSRVQVVAMVELRELADLLGPASAPTQAVMCAEGLTAPRLFRVQTGGRWWLVLVDALPDDTVEIRRWW
jgi:hypothetical protein